MSLRKVFVYGTLKRGEPNHHWITDTREGASTFLYKAQTVNMYPLIIGTKYNIPFLLHCPGQGYNVIGEVYEVDEPMLHHLDVLEDHPKFYVREISDVQIINSDNGSKTVVSCWIYFIKKYKPQLLEQEYFKEYSSYGSHGLKYLERYLRDPSFDIVKNVQKI